MNMKSNLAHEPPEPQGEVVRFPNKTGVAMESEALPNPPMHENVDLRDFAYMPLDVVRFRDSDFAALIDGEAFRAGVLLWCASWHQVPAGSLPSDDRVLASLAGFGRFASEWIKVKESALHGWVLCSDGRLYHPVICEKALESWSSKQQHQYARFADRMRKNNKKLEQENKPQIEIPAIDLWISKGCPKDWQVQQNGIPTAFQRNSNGKLDNSNGNKANSTGNDDISEGIPSNSELKGKGNIRERDIYSSSGSNAHEENFEVQENTIAGYVKYFSDDHKFYSLEELEKSHNVNSDFINQATASYPSLDLNIDHFSSMFDEMRQWSLTANAGKKQPQQWMNTWLNWVKNNSYKLTEKPKQPKQAYQPTSSKNSKTMQAHDEFFAQHGIGLNPESDFIDVHATEIKTIGGNDQ